MLPSLFRCLSFPVSVRLRGDGFMCVCVFVSAYAFVSISITVCLAVCMSLGCLCLSLPLSVCRSPSHYSIVSPVTYAVCFVSSLLRPYIYIYIHVCVCVCVCVHSVPYYKSLHRINLFIMHAYALLLWHSLWSNACSVFRIIMPVFRIIIPRYYTGDEVNLYARHCSFWYECVDPSACWRNQ